MIKLSGVSLRAGEFHFEGLDLALESGLYGTLLGRTGCGKTTLLEVICGLRPLLAGRVSLHGEDVTELPPPERQVGYVPQDGALFPALTVAEHLSLPLEVRRWPRRSRGARVAELAAQLGIEPLLRRHPAGLSGGERQRVALGRALSFRPRVLLLDEPLSALDDETRERMFQLLEEQARLSAATVLHVTHNRAEVERLADRSFRLEDGRIVEDF